MSSFFHSYSLGSVNASTKTAASAADQLAGSRVSWCNRQHQGCGTASEGCCSATQQLSKKARLCVGAIAWLTRVEEPQGAEVAADLADDVQCDCHLRPKQAHPVSLAEI